eukprot:TRINITY_DN71654_c0_g1_i1.p1 TRINITY_DN71654_c0_g1~~TRINITY_DN71654_c0_g1_i1.p1  ORF type:complete len:722 (+),score=159.00 TRINITY_DN71654_c0_g1_i1:111-2168(+)
MEDARCRDLNQVLGPGLEVLRRDVKHRWPSSDPDLMLLEELCRRRGLKPPDMPAKTPRSVPLTVAPAAADLVVRRPDQAAPPMGSDEAVAAAALAATSPTEGQKLPQLPPLTPRPPATAPPAPENRRPAQLGSRSQDAGGEDVVSRSPRDMRLSPYAAVKGLGDLHVKVHADALRSVESCGLMKSQEQRVAKKLAGLRTEIRGKFLSMVPLLATGVLSKTDQYWLVGKLRPWNFDEGDDIVEEGQLGDKLYIIERGRCEVLVGGKVISTIGRKDFFGELAMLHASARSATVRAMTQVTVLSLSRDDLFSTISKEQIAKLAVVMRTRMFTSIPLLQGLSPIFKEQVTMRMKQETWPARTVLARQGHTVSGDTRRMYIIEQGACEQEIRAARAEESIIRTLKPGDFFNMVPMYYGTLLVGTVTTLVPTITLSISYDDLGAVCDEEEDTNGEFNLAEMQKKRAGSVKFDTNGRRGSNKLRGDGKNRRARLRTQSGDDDFEESEHHGDSWDIMRHSMMMNLFQFWLFPAVDIGRNVPAEWSRYILEQSKEVRYSKWSNVFSKGSLLDSVYILESGCLAEHYRDIDSLRDEDELPADDQERSLKPDVCVQHIMPGVILGGYDLEYKRVPARSTVAASGPTQVISVPREALRHILKLKRERDATKAASGTGNSRPTTSQMDDREKYRNRET